ncbi:hypothetical protein [Streptomyces boluensis]|uniref:Uncharacterized protein n=1 Tax=Streptomyces boluensis TaxID=1775135 RepID=A0A964XNR8_9ACTN|nr:hypothetical protein [Streptomyces boluensis]NBE53873.1 hypothetical protein [Streptomyces boluensis]
MATDTANPARPAPAAAVAALRGGVAELARARECGAWTPAPLERRIAELLAVATAGDGLLTADRVRAALWEGAFPLFQENDGRLAALLSQTLKVLHTVDACPRCAYGPGDSGHALRHALRHGDGCAVAVLAEVRAFLVVLARGHAQA